MVLFRAQTGGSDFSLHMIAGYESGSYAKIIKSSHFFSAIGNPTSGNPIALAFKNDNEQAAYIGLWKHSMNVVSLLSISFVDSLIMIGLDADASTGRTLWGGHGKYLGQEMIYFMILDSAGLFNSAPA